MGFLYAIGYKNVDLLFIRIFEWLKFVPCEKSYVKIWRYLFE